jgi:hypothetical protein
MDEGFALSTDNTPPELDSVQVYHQLQNRVAPVTRGA